MKTQITIKEVYEACNYLSLEDSGLTYWIQDYDGYCIENDQGTEQLLSELSDDYPVKILRDGRITIGDYVFTAYVSTKYYF